MSFRGRLTFVLLWFASLVLIGVIAKAQVRPGRSDPGQIISGNDIGFRPEGWDGKARTGTWMVRINGEWVEAKDALMVHHASQ